MKKSPSPKTNEPALNLPWDPKAAELEDARKAQNSDRMSLDEYFEFFEALKPTEAELLDVKIYNERFKLR